MASREQSGDLRLKVAEIHRSVAHGVSPVAGQPGDYPPLVFSREMIERLAGALPPDTTVESFLPRLLLYGAALRPGLRLLGDGEEDSLQ